MRFLLYKFPLAWEFFLFSRVRWQTVSIKQFAAYSNTNKLPSANYSVEGFFDKRSFYMWNDMFILEKESMINVEYLLEFLSSIALYVTIALIVGLLGYAFAVRNKDEQCQAVARKTMLGIVIGYIVGVISTLGVIKMIYSIMDGGINKGFWLIVAFLAVVVVGVVVVAVLKRNNVTWSKWVALGLAVLLAIGAILMLILMKGESLNDVQMYLFSALLVLVAVVPAFFLDKKSSYDPRALTYGAICIASSFALSYVKFFSLPLGGSVTFASLLPLALYAYMFGMKKGLIAGLVYGLLQFIQSPQFYHPMQALLDYPIAFGVVGVVGITRHLKLFKDNVIAQFVVGVSIAVTLRYFAHVISGYYVFYEWALEGFTPLGYAFAYNTFTFVDLAILVVMALFVLASKNVRRIVMDVAVENY